MAETPPEVKLTGWNDGSSATALEADSVCNGSKKKQSTDNREVPAFMDTSFAARIRRSNRGNSDQLKAHWHGHTP